MNTYSDQIEENVITETKDDDSTPSGNDVSNTQENWPQPPSSFEIESMNMAREDRSAYFFIFPIFCLHFVGCFLFL